jgi:hypothetical protein
MCSTVSMFSTVANWEHSTSSPTAPPIATTTATTLKARAREMKLRIACGNGKKGGGVTSFPQAATSRRRRSRGLAGTEDNAGDYDGDGDGDGDGDDAGGVGTSAGVLGRLPEWFRGPVLRACPDFASSIYANPRYGSRPSCAR